VDGVPSAAPIAFLRDLLAPPRCATCAAPCEAREILCRACGHELECAGAGSITLDGIGPVIWSAPYEGTARALVAALKFRGGLGLARVAAAAIGTDVVARGPVELPTAAVANSTDGRPGGWTVVAVPPAPLRRRQRGYDPAELIAAEVASLLGLPIEAPLARANGPRQVGRRRSERLAAPPRVRAVTGAPARALLVDDVLTTGATLAASAAALRAGGCIEVEAAVFARAVGSPYPGA
jgi:predicted amidophosphoribosyltransferase